MKKVFLSAAVAVCVIAGMTATKANNAHRATTFFKYLGTSTTDVDQLKDVANWQSSSTVFTACTGTQTILCTASSATTYPTVASIITYVNAHNALPTVDFTTLSKKP